MFNVFSIALLSLLLTSCSINDKQPEGNLVAVDPYLPYNNLIKESVATVKEGDLILRNGQEFSSQFIKQFNRTDKSYSHAGLIFFNNGYPYVYDIVPGDENPDAKLRIDSLKKFCDPRKNFGFAIYRYNISVQEVESLRKTIEKWKREGVSFDSTFNLKTDDRMYCSEMIKKSLAKATSNRIIISTTKTTKKEAKFFSSYLHLPLSYTTNLSVVAIDNLFINPNCTIVRRFDFNQK